MGAPYSAPPLWPIFLAYGGLFAWGYLCGRVRDKIASLLLVPSPFLALSIYYPGMFGQMEAVVSLLWYSLLFIVPSYLVGFFHKRRKSKGSEQEPKKTVMPTVSSVFRFALFILYAAAFFVSILHLFGHSFPTGYYFAVMFVAIAIVVYCFLRKRIRRISPF